MLDGPVPGYRVVQSYSGFSSHSWDGKSLVPSFTSILEQANKFTNDLDTKFNSINIRLDKIMTSLDNLTAQVTKNNADIDLALAAIANSGATPAQLDALTSAIAAKDALIETALQTPPPTPAP